MCVKHSTLFQRSDWKALVFQPGDAQVVPCWGVVGENRFSPTKLPLTVLAFSDTLVPIHQKERHARRWRTFPPASGCGLGSDERTHHWANSDVEEEASPSAQSLADLSHEPALWAGSVTANSDPHPIPGGSISPWGEPFCVRTRVSPAKRERRHSSMKTAHKIRMNPTPEQV